MESEACAGCATECTLYLEVFWDCKCGESEVQTGRKTVMDKILEALRAEGLRRGNGLADVLKPLLLKAEGVLNDAIRLEERKNSAQGKGSQQDRNRRLDGSS